MMEVVLQWVSTIPEQKKNIPEQNVNLSLWEIPFKNLYYYKQQYSELISGGLYEAITT